MSFPKRLFVYIILLITLNVFCFSSSGIIGWALDLVNVIGDVAITDIAPFLAAIIVSFPIWVFLWRFVQKYVGVNTAESTATLRHLYLNIVLGIATVNLSFFSYRFFEGTLNLFNGFQMSHFANLIVWLPIFMIHVKPAQEGWFTFDSRKRIHEFYLNLTFLISLGVIFFSCREIVFEVLDYFMRLVFSKDILISTNLNFDYNPNDISRLITGSVLWLYSWNFRIKNKNSGFRIVTVSVITVSQIFVFLVSLFIVLAQFILLLLNLSSNDESLLVVFQFLPEVLSFSVVSIIIWAYYSSSFLEVKGLKRFFELNPQLIKWIYRYSIRVIAVIFLIACLVSIQVFILELPGRFLGYNLLIDEQSKWEFELISVSLSALIMGLVILKYINYRIKIDDLDDYKNRVEKSYIYLVAIVFIVVLVGALIAMLTIIIRDIFGLSLGISTLEKVRWPLSFAISSLSILLLYKNNISSQFKLASATYTKEYKVEILDSGSLEKHKDQLSRLFKIKKWNSVEKVGKFSINKGQIENISNELEKLGSNKEFILVEGNDKQIWVYYYNN